MRGGEVGVVVASIAIFGPTSEPECLKPSNDRGQSHVDSNQ